MQMKNPWKRHEGYFKGYNTEKLFYQEWSQPQPKGLIIITHGHGEHSESYHRLIDGLYGSGWNFIAWDWRGHGRSEGKRGYAGHFSHYVGDYQKFLELLSRQSAYRQLPWVTLGHSMGGLIQTNELLQNKMNLPIRAQILSAPLLGMRVEVPLLKDVAALAAFHVYPKLTLWNELYPHQFTRDTEVLKEYEKDPLRHDRMSPGVYIGFLQAFEFVHKHAGSLRLPTLLQLAGQDSVVSNTDSERFFEALGSPLKKKILYPESFHEIYNDLDREKSFQDIIDFIRPFSLES